MKVYLKKLLKHRTFKNISYLAFGNVLAQFLALIGAFYIPKLLGPQNYGIYNTVITYVGLFGILTFSGLNKVIIREAAKNPDEIKIILESIIGVKNLFIIVALILITFITIFVNYEIGTKIYIYIYSITLILQSIRGTLFSIFNSFQKMKILGILAVFRQIIRVPAAIILLINGYGILSLIILHIFIEIIVLTILYKKSKEIVIFNFFSKIKIIKKYITSGIRFTILEFFNILSGKIDIIMLSFLTQPYYVGIYALAYRITEKSLLIRAPISQSLFPYYSNKFKKYNPKVKDIIKHCLLILLVMILGIVPVYYIIKILILNFMGSNYFESIKIIKILFIYLVINFTIIPLGLSLQTNYYENYTMIIVIFTAISNIIFNIVLYNFYGIIGVAYSTVIVEIIRFSLLTYFNYKLFKE